MSDCAACAQPIADTAYCCGDCTHRLDEQLRRAADLAPELDVALARQTRFADPGPRPRNSAPAIAVARRHDDHADDYLTGPANGLPYSEAVSITIGSILNIAAVWTRYVADHRGHHWPAHTTAGMCAYLATQLDWLRYQPDAAAAFDELGYACRLVERAVDRPAPRVDAGLCLAVDDHGQTCQQRLSAAPAAAYVHCPTCRTTWSVLDRSAVILAAAQNIRLTAEEAATLLTIHRWPTPAATIRSWAKRGRIARDHNWRYRFGDIHHLRITQDPQRERCSA